MMRDGPQVDVPALPRLLLLLLLGRVAEEAEDHSHGRTHNRHPHDGHGSRHAHQVLAKVELGQEEAEGGRLHRGLDGGGARDSLILLDELEEHVGQGAARGMQQRGRRLEGQTSVEDGSGDLRHGGAHEQAGHDDAHNGAHRLHFLHRLGEELVERHAQGDGREDHLRRGLCDAHGVHGHHGAQQPLAQQRGHEEHTNCGGGGHDH
mmetsp:Transcript_27768/g.74762  ORF Transcript_27768/g.74762 Transcript_27768/m.74762 type:complete len:206 (+) Transcript_27768:399-1016(+)